MTGVSRRSTLDAQAMLLRFLQSGDLRALHQLCREGRLYDVERWIADRRPLQLAPEAIGEGTRPKTALQIALETGQHSLAFLLLNNDPDEHFIGWSAAPPHHRHGPSDPPLVGINPF